MNPSNNNTLLKGRPKKKGFKGSSESNKKDHELSKQKGTETNDKIQTQFSFKKKAVLF